MKGNIRLGIILALFAAIGCASLAVVYLVTKEAIATQNERAFNTSLKELFPDSNGQTEDITASIKSSDPGVSILSAVLVKSNQAPLGVAVKASGASYGGQASVLVGVGLARSIEGVRILDLNDTPGLGMNAKNPNYYVKKADKVTFSGQFVGKSIGDAFEVKKDVAAITAATITSRSLTKIIKAAADAAAAWLESSAVAGTTATTTMAPTTTGSSGGK
jgi:electron transport complex protein RnfG